MRAAMTAGPIRSLCQAVPFRPFVIHLKGGATFPVRHPECVILTGDEAGLIVAQPDESSLTIDLNSISDIEVKAAPHRPGQRREG